MGESVLGKKAPCELLGWKPHEGAHLGARKEGEKGLSGGVRVSIHPPTHPFIHHGGTEIHPPPSRFGRALPGKSETDIVEFSHKKCLSKPRNLVNEKSGGGRHTGTRAPPPDQEAVGCLDTHPRPLNMVSNFPSNHTPLPLGGGVCPRCR